jgi:prophage regulatory protein
LTLSQANCQLFSIISGNYLEIPPTAFYYLRQIKSFGGGIVSSSTALFLSDKQTADRYGVQRTTIWRWVKEEGFPGPVNLSRGCTRWPLGAIEKWEQRKIGEKAA